MFIINRRYKNYIILYNYIIEIGYQVHRKGGQLKFMNSRLWENNKIKEGIESIKYRYFVRCKFFHCIC